MAYTAALKRGSAATNGSRTRNFASRDALWNFIMYAAEFKRISLYQFSTFGCNC